MRERLGLRIVNCSIQGNHLHLIVEAEDAAALSRAMQAFCIRLAKRLNALASRRQVANAVRYVLRNYRHHARESLPSGWEDALSSARSPACGLRLYWRLRAPPRSAPGLVRVERVVVVGAAPSPQRSDLRPPSKCSAWTPLPARMRPR